MHREQVGPSSLGPRPGDAIPLIRSSQILCSAIHELEEDVLRELTAGLTPRQLQLLTFIAVAPHHIEEVARFLDVTGPAATRAVDVLERRGLVARRSSPTDRRLRILCCSAKGRRLMARYRSRERERLAAALAALTTDDIADLSRLLERYALALLAGASPSTVCLRCAGHFGGDCPLQLVGSFCACLPARGPHDV